MYYVVIIKPDSQAVNRFETLDAAYAAFHTEMAYAYTAQISTTCYITDNGGNMKVRECYEAPIPNTDEEVPDDV